MKPKFKEVCKEEFVSFLDKYPNNLSGDVYGSCEPPVETYNDFSNGKVWPESVVAKVYRNWDEPYQYFILGEGKE